MAAGVKKIPAAKTISIKGGTGPITYKPRSTKIVEQWRPLVAKYFPANQVDNTLNVMACESGTHGPGAIGDTSLTFKRGDVLYGYSVGLMQIRRLPGRPGDAYLLDPENNIRHAAGMYRAQGWQPWTCARIIGLIK